MNCQQVHDNIEGYYEGVLPVADELGIDIHLVQCPTCHAELGDIFQVVHDCHDAFKLLPETLDMEELQQGIEDLNAKVLETEENRSRVFRKETMLRFLLIGVAIPALFVLGNKVAGTYAAYDNQFESTQQHIESQQSVPDYLSHDSVDLDW